MLYYVNVITCQDLAMNASALKHLKSELKRIYNNNINVRIWICLHRPPIQVPIDVINSMLLYDANTAYRVGLGGLVLSAVGYMTYISRVNRV